MLHSLSGELLSWAMKDLEDHGKDLVSKEMPVLLVILPGLWCMFCNLVYSQMMISYDPGCSYRIFFYGLVCVCIILYVLL